MKISLESNTKWYMSFTSVNLIKWGDRERTKKNKNIIIITMGIETKIKTIHGNLQLYI